MYHSVFVFQIITFKYRGKIAIWQRCVLKQLCAAHMAPKTAVKEDEAKQIYAE